MRELERIARREIVAVGGAIEREQFGHGNHIKIWWRLNGQRFYQTVTRSESCIRAARNVRASIRRQARSVAP